MKEKKTLQPASSKTEVPGKQEIIDSTVTMSIRSHGSGIWNRFFSGSVHRRVLGATFTIGGISVGVKLVAMIKESIVAMHFGTGDAYDAYIIALLAPMTITSLISGSLNTALIPSYLKVFETEGKDAAGRLYSTILCLNLLLLAVLSLAVFSTPQWWLPLIASGFDPTKLSLATVLVYWLVPLVLLSGLSTTWGAVLNAQEKFRAVAIAPIGQPVAIISLLVLAPRPTSIFVLLAGTLIGAAMEAAIIGWALARSGHSLLPKWYGVTNAVRRVGGQYTATMSGALLMSAGTITDQAMAAMLGSRSNAALSYGSKIPMLVIGLGGSALGTAILPPLSQLAVKKDWRAFCQFVWSYAKKTAIVSAVIALILLVLSPPLTALIFERGVFSSSDTQLVMQIQLFYLLRVPVPIIATVLVRAITAMRLNQMLTIVAVVQVVLNAALNYIFMRHFGVTGIALSSLVVSLVAFLLVATVLNYSLRRLINNTHGDVL